MFIKHLIRCLFISAVTCNSTDISSHQSTQETLSLLAYTAMESSVTGTYDIPTYHASQTSRSGKLSSTILLKYHFLS